ncbi:MAG: EI24 domain-containing protein [Aquabacterium sp.]|nr:EI24 domain-containing protein [Aquabacterium sp.]
MKRMLDAFWRAAAYCLHPTVIGLSLLPLLVGGALSLLLGWLYWDAAVAGMRAILESMSLLEAALRWVESMVGGSFRAVLAPLFVVLLAVPVLVVASLLLVAALMAPAVVSLVARRRFPALERRRGAGVLTSIAWSLTCTALALVALLATVPLWLIPPLVLLLPPLIWGWLTYRVMSFDALADHADASERHQVMREHRVPLLAMGVITGYIGAAPTLLWALSAATLVFAPVLVVASIWLYTMIFAFSMLWFAHYALAALSELRARKPVQPAAVEVPVPAPVQALPASAAPPPALPPSH